MNRPARSADSPEHFVVLFFPSSHIIDEDFAAQAQRVAAELEAAGGRKPVPIKTLKVQVSYLVTAPRRSVVAALERALSSTSPYFIAPIGGPCEAPGLRDTLRFLKEAGLAPP